MAADFIQIDTAGAAVVYEEAAQVRINAAGAAVVYEEAAQVRINAAGAAVVYQPSPKIQVDAGGLAVAYREPEPACHCYLDEIAFAEMGFPGPLESLDNIEPLLIGAESASSGRYAGDIELIRLDKGRVIPATWWAREWERLRWGYPRFGLKDFVELFDFEQSLVGEAAALRTLAWQGGGEPVYVDGWPYNAAPLSLLISKGKLGWEGDDEELDAADWDRALDGTANSYLHYAKRRLVWPLAGLTYGDAIALRAAYLSGKPLTLSRNCDEPAENSRGYIFASPPKLQEILANLWSGEAEFDEV